MAEKSFEWKKLSERRETWIGIVVALIIIVVLVTTCSGPTEIAPMEPVPEEPVPEPELIEPEPEPVPEKKPLPPEREPNPEVTELLQKKTVSSFEFILAKYELDAEGDLEPRIIGTYKVKGSEAKIELPTNFFIEDAGWSADYIFIDSRAKKAIGYCLDFGSCKGEEKKAGTDYARYEFVSPDAWFDKLQYGELYGRETSNNRLVHVIRWEEDGKYWQAQIDDFFGYPIQVLGYSTPQRERENVVDGYDYRDISFNTVKSEDVEAPY